MSNIATLDQALAQAAKLHRLLREAGLPDEALQWPIDDPGMRERLVRFWNSGGYESTTSQKRAQEIMGRNMFGVEEAVQYFRVRPTQAELRALAEIPFTEAILRECQDSHILVAVFPMSIIEIRDKVPNDQHLFYNQDWYNKESFAKNRGEAAWHLVRKTPVANSTSKTWGEQRALLATNEETPTARVMTYTIIGHFLATGERLFENVYVRCPDVGSDSSRATVGFFTSDGQHVGSIRDGSRDVILDVASARKPDKTLKS